MIRLNEYLKVIAPVAQLDRALPSGGRGQRFESSRARQIKNPAICGVLYLLSLRVDEKLTRFDRIVGNDSERRSLATTAPKGRSTRTYGVILSILTFLCRTHPSDFQPSGHSVLAHPLGRAKQRTLHMAGFFIECCVRVFLSPLLRWGHPGWYVIGNRGF